MIIGIFIPPPEDLLAGLIVARFVTNCTGYLAGKLSRLLKLLEDKETRSPLLQEYLREFIFYPPIIYNLFIDFSHLRGYNHHNLKRRYIK